MKKIMMVFGTRPEAIKMCPLVLELKKRDGVNIIVCVTAQHRQMLDQVLDTFGIVPDYDLNIMKDRQTLFDITSNILSEIRLIIEKETPDIVLVHGDTSTTFVTALACFYLQIPVGHVEAGLRTYNIFSPYPEEFNRQAVGIVSQFNFAPTQLAAEHLIREGKNPESVYITGLLAIVWAIITLCTYSDTVHNSFRVESERKIFTSRGGSFRRTDSGLVQDKNEMRKQVVRPVFYEKIDGVMKPVLLKFTSPLRIAHTAGLSLFVLFLPVIIALFLNGFDFQRLELGGSAVWFCIFVPVIPVYILKFARIELYERPWIYLLSPDGSRKKYRKKQAPAVLPLVLREPVLSVSYVSCQAGE